MRFVYTKISRPKHEIMLRRIVHNLYCIYRAMSASTSVWRQYDGVIYWW